jgi:hypothetical protein
VDCSPIEVLGAKKIDFELWVKLFTRVTIRVVKGIPSKMLLGPIFLLEHKIVLDMQ